MEQETYGQVVQQVNPKTPYVKNAFLAFLTGGVICVIGQVVLYIYLYFFNFTEKTAGNPTVATMIFLAMLATGFGYYRKLGLFAGAGSAVPVTGFGNAVISAAIETRTEGFVIGVGGGMFKLAGAVILFGVVSAFVVTIIKLLFVTIGVITW
jgi:stage V sporulation protein AC